MILPFCLEITSGVLVSVFAHELSALCTFLYSKNLMISIPASKCIILRRSNKVIVYISVGRTSNSGDLKLIYTLVGCGLNIHVRYSILLQCFLWGRGVSPLAFMVPTPTVQSSLCIYIDNLSNLSLYRKGPVQKAALPENNKKTKNHSSGEKLHIMN